MPHGLRTRSRSWLVAGPVALGLLAGATTVGLASSGSGGGSDPVQIRALDHGDRKANQRQANRKVKRVVKNGRYVGTRGDGQSLDHIYCANGKYRANTGGGISTGKGWKIKDAVITRHGFTAIIFAKVPGGSYQVAIAKQRKQWQIGIAFGASPSSFGDVERTNAKPDCAAGLVSPA